MHGYHRRDAQTRARGSIEPRSKGAIDFFLPAEIVRAFSCRFIRFNVWREGSNGAGLSWSGMSFFLRRWYWLLQHLAFRAGIASVGICWRESGCQLLSSCAACAVSAGAAGNGGRGHEVDGVVMVVLGVGDF